MSTVRPAAFYCLVSLFLALAPGTAQAQLERIDVPRGVLRTALFSSLMNAERFSIPFMWALDRLAEGTNEVGVPLMSEDVVPLKPLPASTLPEVKLVLGYRANTVS